jgi:hypothetical protein
MTTLNGWQRLWLLVSILWAFVILALAGRFLPDSGWSTQTGLFVGRLWIVPVAAIYGIGLGLAWVIRGFKASRADRHPGAASAP